jgi:hypothetical protein
MEKPQAKLIGENGNIFNLIAIASETLKKNGMQEEAKKMQNECWKCQSYEEALMKISEYVEIV